MSAFFLKYLKYLSLFRFIPFLLRTNTLMSAVPHAAEETQAENSACVLALDLPKEGGACYKPCETRRPEKHTVPQKKGYRKDIPAAGCTVICSAV